MKNAAPTKSKRPFFLLNRMVSQNHLLLISTSTKTTTEWMVCNMLKERMQRKICYLLWRMQKKGHTYCQNAFPFDVIVCQTLSQNVLISFLQKSWTEKNKMENRKSSYNKKVYRTKSKHSINIYRCWQQTNQKNENRLEYFTYSIDFGLSIPSHQAKLFARFHQ